MTLGLSSQIELDIEVEKAAKNAPKPIEGEEPQTLMPVDETTSEEAIAAAFAKPAPKTREEEEAVDADAVFANFKSSGDSDEDEDER